MTTTPTDDSPWYPDDSGEWVEHDGSVMPVPGDTLVLVLLAYERSRWRVRCWGHPLPCG